MPDRGQILQELARRGALPEQHKAEYEQMRDAGTIAPKGGFKPMPDASATKLEEQVSAYAGLDRAVTNFKDDYSGVGSSVENMAQGWLGTGTPGQRDWWSDFKASDNQVRNALFGASLTPSEQASYAATSITPSMAPEEIRINLERRRNLARDVLGRRAAFARTNGYTPEAVTSILGEYDPAKQGVTISDAGVENVGGFKDQLPAEPMNQLSDEDQRAYFNLTKTAKTPGELVGFMADRGFMMDPARAKAIIDYRNKYGKVAGSIEYQKQRPIDRGDGATGAALRGVADTATFGGLDEIGGVIDTIAGEGGEGSFTDRLYRNIDYNRAVQEGDAQNHPYARLGGQLVGGAVVPFGAGARSAGQLARVGAAGGAAYGFGSGEGGLIDRVPDALGGGALGGAGGYGFGRAAPAVGNALARFAPGVTAPRVEANALAQAGARQGVPMTAADLRPGARNAFAFLEASPGGAGPAQNALAAGTDALEGAVSRIGGGTARSPEEIGSSFQNAGRRAIEWSRNQKNDLYHSAERLAPTVTVRSQGALDAVDRNIAELSETPNANRGVLSLLEDLRGDLTTVNSSTGRYTPRSLTIASIRNLRTSLRGEIGSRNLTMTDAERRVSQIIDAASSDITGALNAANPRAAAAYQRADRFYAQRQRYIGEIIQHYTGPRDRPISGEDAYARIVALTGQRGDRERLVETMRALSPDERADVATTIASPLGRRTPEDDFSPARFVTQAEKMTAGARQAVFGTEGAAAVDDLIRIASAKRDTGNSLNRSRSGQVGAYNSMLTGALGLLGAGGGYAAGGAGGAALGAVAASSLKMGALNLSARVLTNPQFVAWLGRAPTTATPSQITAHVRQLSNLAIRQPAIRGEIGQLQRMLTETSARPALAGDGAPGNEQQGYGNQAVAARR